MSQFLGIVVTHTDIFGLYAEVHEPVIAVILPIYEPIKLRAGLAEEFKLHLLKLADTEDKVTGGNFVTEGFTYLSNAEGDLLACGSLNGFEINKDTLSGLGTEIDLAGAVLGNALEGLEHKVEFANIGKILASARGAGNVVLGDKLRKLIIRPSAGIYVESVFCGIVLNKLVCSVTGLALAAVHKRIGKSANVTGCDPDLRVHKDGRVKTYIVLALLYEFFPPSSFYVVFVFNTERTVVPRVCKAAVDL